MFHGSIQGATGPDGEVLETIGVFGGGGRGNAPQPTGIARAICGATNPYNVEHVDAAPVRELILKRGIRWAVIPQFDSGWKHRSSNHCLLSRVKSFGRVIRHGLSR